MLLFPTNLRRNSELKGSAYGFQGISSELSIGGNIVLSVKLLAIEAAIQALPPRILHGISRIGSTLLFNDRNRYKNNLAKQRDAIAEPIDPRVGITNREIRVDSGENVIH